MYTMYQITIGASFIMCEGNPLLVHFTCAKLNPLSSEIRSVYELPDAPIQPY